MVYTCDNSMSHRVIFNHFKTINIIFNDFFLPGVIVILQ